jgi:Domain of unknown function (DUF4406)
VKTIYISGPITGKRNLNRAAFESAASTVSGFGLTPVNPHDLCKPEWGWQQCMRKDVEELTKCDAILMLKGWRHSKGARLEMYIASELGLRVIKTIGQLDKYANGADE